MNERVMQFRIGIFVIVAGLVLTMLIVWFGESPALLRDHEYVVVHFTEAPGVSEGIPVRKSGIRIGEVAAVEFDQRPGQPDGVLVTLSIERKYRIKQGSTPRISRALIGDVSIDMLPGAGPGFLKMSSSVSHAPIIEGAVSPDPANALVAATATLESISKAADSITGIAKRAEGIDQLLVTWRTAGEKLGSASESVDRLIKTNEGNFEPAIASFRQFAENANTTFDPQTQSQLKAGIDRFSTAAARLDSGLTDLQPFVKDLGAGPDTRPTTNFGWSILRFNRVMYDFALLSKSLEDQNDPSKLNANGSLQKLITNKELYDNMNMAAIHLGKFFADGHRALGYLSTFAEKIARDPSEISRGALRPR